MSPRNAEQNRKVRDERREQLLRAALRVFARKGLAAAKIGDIASAAGLSHGLVYHYFKSKDEIFTVLVEHAMASSGQVIEHAAMQPGSSWDKLRWLTNMMLSHSGDDAAYYFMIVLQAFTSDAVPDAVKTIVERMSLAPTELLVPILEAGQREGQVVAGDARQLAVLFFSLVQGLMLIAVERPGEFAMPDADSVLRLLKA